MTKLSIANPNSISQEESRPESGSKQVSQEDCRPQSRQKSPKGRKSKKSLGVLFRSTFKIAVAKFHKLYGFEGESRYSSLGCIELAFSTGIFLVITK